VNGYAVVSGGGVVSVCGVMPGVGDAVLLGPPAGVQFTAPEFPAWMRVIKVEPGLTQGFVYLTGWTARDIANAAPPRREFCRVAGLVIRRQPERLPDDRNDLRRARTERHRLSVLGVAS
jgi:hypothetical protein